MQSLFSGSGKTAAFLVPILSRIYEEGPFETAVSMLILPYPACLNIENRKMNQFSISRHIFLNLSC